MKESKTTGKSTLGYVFSISMLVSIGLQPIINNSAPGDANRLIFTFMTVFIEFIFITPVLATEIKIGKKPFKQFACSKTTWSEYWWRFLLIGTIFAVATFLVIFGYANTDPISGAIAVRLQPVSMLVIGYFFLKENISKWQVLFTAIMLFSVYHMSTMGTWSLSHFSFGIIFLLLAPVLWNVGHSIAKPMLNSGRVLTPQLIFIRTGISSIILLITCSIFNKGAFSWQVFDLNYLLFMVFMGLNYTVQHYLLYKSMTYIDLTIITAIMIPSPVATTILSFFIFHQNPELYHVIGMIGSFLGLYGLLYEKIRRERKSEDHNKERNTS